MTLAVLEMLARSLINAFNFDKHFSRLGTFSIRRHYFGKIVFISTPTVKAVFSMFDENSCKKSIK